MRQFAFRKIGTTDSGKSVVGFFTRRTKYISSNFSKHEISYNE